MATAKKSAKRESAKKAPAKPARKAAGAARPKPPASPMPEVGDDAVLRATGRTWDGWCKALDADGAAAIGHKAIALHLSGKYGVGDWWCQMVTVGYERARGLRDKGQRLDGWSTSASRTIAAPAARIFEAWESPALRRRWLPGADLTIRKANPHKSMRITWNPEGTSVDLLLTPKGGDRCQVAVQHSKLPDKAQMERMKAYWSERLDALRAMVAPL